MGPYLPLFSLDVEHDFFSDGRWRHVRFEPAPASGALMGKAGLLLRKNVNGIELYYDRSRIDALKLFLADANGELGFQFKAYVDDEAFKNYSEAFLCDPSALAYFDSDNGVPVEGRIRLHPGERASDEDLQPVGSERFADLLGRRERHLPPVAPAIR